MIRIEHSGFEKDGFLYPPMKLEIPNHVRRIGIFGLMVQARQPFLKLCKDWLMLRIN